MTRARFVRIRDLSTRGEGTNAGFDLDAVGLVHYAIETKHLMDCVTCHR